MKTCVIVSTWIKKLTDKYGYFTLYESGGIISIFLVTYIDIPDKIFVLPFGVCISLGGKLSHASRILLQAYCRPEEVCEMHVKACHQAKYRLRKVTKISIQHD